MRYSALAGWSIGLWLAACAAQPEAPKPKPRPLPAQTVLRGGSVVTLDAAKPRAQALALKGGKIIAVGSDEEISGYIGPQTQVIELKGNYVVPGLVDAHMHLTGLGLKRFKLDLIGTRTLDEVLARVKKATEKVPPGTWVLGRGWDQNDWQGFKGFPTHKDLDKVSKDHPVVLTRVDGHAIWVNKKALELSKITYRTKSPKGGQIIKKRRRPTGILVDSAMELVRSHIPPPTDEILEKAMLLSQAECLASGLTQVHDMGIEARELEILKKLNQEGKLKLRVYANHWGNIENLAEALKEGPIVPTDPQKDRLTVRGVKLMADGALGSRGAALLEPYHDDPKNQGKLILSEAELSQRVVMAHQAGFQLAIHAIGDRANRLVLDTFRVVLGPKAEKMRPRLEHAQVLAPADLLRLGPEHVIASMQPTHATSDMPWAEERLGPERIKGAYAWQTLLTKGATIAAGSDAPVEDISAVLGLYAAATRTDLLGEPAGGWRAEEALSRQQALAAFTKGAAFASFRENEAGTIKPGFWADLTIVDQDPINAKDEDLAMAQIVYTIIHGEVVYQMPAPAVQASR